MTAGDRPSGRDPTRWIAGSFAASALASLGLTVVYALGGQPQLEGIFLGIALGGLGAGLGWSALRLLPDGSAVEARDVVPHQTEARPEAKEAFAVGAAPIERRSFIAKMLGAAIAALGIAALFPIRSLGARPGRALFGTAWTAGARAVNELGAPILAETLDVGAVVTVFPEGALEAADSQTLLIRLPPDAYDPAPGREDWAPRGLIAFSKICTHAGCPVGLYQTESQELFCPCHQSVFAVLRGAEPTFGPATRPLPQLPLAIDDDGYVIATDDFPEPVGPGFWSRGRA